MVMEEPMAPPAQNPKLEKQEIRILQAKMEASREQGMEAQEGEAMMTPMVN